MSRRRRRLILFSTLHEGITIGPWTEARPATTVLSIADDRARATSTDGSIPAIARHLTNLEPGATYRIQTTLYLGTAANLFFRVSSTSELSGDYMDFNGGSIPEPVTLDQTFAVPVATEAWAGIVVLSDGVAGAFSETDENFILTKVAA